VNPGSRREHRTSRATLHCRTGDADAQAETVHDDDQKRFSPKSAASPITC
jgi:hypothetical protein